MPSACAVPHSGSSAGTITCLLTNASHCLTLFTTLLFEQPAVSISFDVTCGQANILYVYSHGTLIQPRTSCHSLSQVTHSCVPARR
jgi:ABC-type uncharacterized transport system permease subunit